MKTNSKTAQTLIVILFLSTSATTRPALSDENLRTPLNNNKRESVAINKESLKKISQRLKDFSTQTINYVGMITHLPNAYEVNKEKWKKQLVDTIEFSQCTFREAHQATKYSDLKAQEPSIIRDLMNAQQNLYALIPEEQQTEERKRNYQQATSWKAKALDAIKRYPDFRKDNNCSHLFPSATSD